MAKNTVEAPEALVVGRSMSRRDFLKLSGTGFAGAALLLGSAGCGGEGEQEGSGPIEIGSALGLTGYLTNFDSPVRSGIDLAAESINDDGGVLDRSLEVRFEDMEADPQQGVLAVQRIATEGQPVAFLNGFSSAATAAEAPIAEQNQIPMIVESVLPENDEWVFSTIPPVVFETGVRIDYLSRQGLERVAILHDPTPYNKLQLEAATKQLNEAGMTLTGVEQHETNAVDLRSQVTRLLRDDPDAIVKMSGGPSQIAAARALSQANSDIPLLLSIDSLSIVQDAKGAYDNVLFAAVPPQVYSALKESERSDALVEFMEAFERTSSEKGDPAYAGRGWDSVFLLKKAIEQAGEVSGPAIRDELEKMGPFPGTSGTYNFSQDSHYGLTENPMYVASFTKDEKVEIVFRPRG